MAEATITVQQVDEKSGEKDGRKWTKYTIKDAGGEFYSTFDRAVVSPAFDLVGKRAVIEYDVSGKFKNLKSVKPSENGSGLPDPYVAKTSDGGPDWDKKGLHMTRCALWNHFLSGHLAANLYAKAVANGDGRDPIDHVIVTGTRLIVHAEKDVFERAAGDDGIPFLSDEETPF